MICSSSISIHLLRGLGALGLIIGAIYFNSLWSLPAVIGAIVLMRGCPMCWLMGLIETVQENHAKKSSAAPSP